MIARLERGHRGTDLLDDADAFVTKDRSRFAGRHVALQNMQIGSTNRRLYDLDDGVGGGSDPGLRTVFQGLFVWKQKATTDAPDTYNA